MSNQSGKFVPQEVLDSMMEVIDYLWESEQENLVDFVRENGDSDGHIFHELLKVSNFVRDEDVSIDDVIDDSPYSALVDRDDIDDEFNSSEEDNKETE